MEIQQNFIKKVNKEKILYLYKEISKRIENDIYEKLLNNNNSNNTDNNIEKDKNKIIIQIISQIKKNIANNPIDFSIYKDSENEIEIKNKNYYQVNPTDNFFTFKSYPSENLLFLLINNIMLSFLNKFFCFKFFSMKLVNISEEDSITPLNEKINNIINNKEISDIYNYLIENIFIFFNSRDILTFFGIRKTTGSIDDYIPLDKILLINKFKELNNPKSTLTVGAKALCKHSHRSVTDPFWPGQGGKEKDKNENAEKMLNLFLNECVWINIHLLPHQLIIIELRIDKGYGIRWQANDGMFRGFLEPQMEDGHDKGWIH